MNKELLEEVAVAIEKHPRQVNMNDWITDQDGVGDKPTGCGTAGCIAGWIVLTDNRKTRKRRKLSDIDRCVIADKAVLAADLDYRQAEKLFYTCDWPEQFKEKLYAANTADDYANVVAERLRRFIKSGGRV